MDWGTIIGLIAVIVSTIGYLPYIINVFLAKTKPHAFSWLIWAVLTGISSVVQLTEGAGPGAWVTIATSISTGFIFVLSFKYGTHDIKRFDWIILFSAFVAIIPWVITRDPLLSIILVTFIQVSGFLPTARKVYKHPHEETAVTFVANGAKFYLGIFALSAFSIETVFFPLIAGSANIALVVLIIARRRTHENNRDR